MEPIIEEKDKSLLAEEIKRQVCLSELTRGNMELYVVQGHKAPALMREIGRRREIAFRTAGGGTGLSCDVDRYDLDPESGFRQLICWDSKNCEVMGGYRILFGKDCRLDLNGQPDIPSAHLFRFSEQFISEQLPDMMEMRCCANAMIYIVCLERLPFTLHIPARHWGCWKPSLQSIVPILIPGSFRIIHTLCLFPIMPPVFCHTTAMRMTLKHLPRHCMKESSICLQSLNHI